MTSSLFREPRFEPPYDRELGGILSFATLAATEETIRHLENLRQRFLAASDKKGVEYCRRLGVIGRKRAEVVARNPRVSPDKRLQKAEAARWFAVWLDAPELFEDWLILRKSSADFQHQAGAEMSS